MSRFTIPRALALALALVQPAALCAQQSQAAAPVPTRDAFGDAAAELTAKLEASVAELNRLRATIAAEKIPLARRLGEREAELSAVRVEFQQTTRTLDSRSLALSNLRGEVSSREDEATYLSNLLSEYLRNFESRLHVAEAQRYEQAVETARLAADNPTLPDGERYAAQVALLSVALERLHDALGGTRFEGVAVDADSLVQRGSFLLVGPAALFRSADGSHVGTAEQFSSSQPAQVAFDDPALNAHASALVSSGHGLFPLDPSLGNAHKIAATEETFVEHVQKGGPVMIPIFAMAAAAFLVALFKWLGMAFLRTPSRKKLDKLLEAVGHRDEELVRQRLRLLPGPVGRMLTTGVEHIREPRELIEEVMYETVLRTRLRLERFLPFISICAASAPLLGLLGTVTGIINTFKLIQVFGSGDVKTLSGGISEALITTEFGLIVAIPSLLLHAFLSRKARGMVNQMETAAVAFINQVSKFPWVLPVRSDPDERAPDDPERVRRQVKEALGDLLAPVMGAAPARGEASGGGGARPSDARQQVPAGV